MMLAVSGMTGEEIDETSVLTTFRSVTPCRLTTFYGVVSLSFK